MSFDPFGTNMKNRLSPNGRKSKIVSLKRQSGLLTTVEQTAYNLFSLLSPTSTYLILSQVHLLQLFKIDQNLIDEELHRHNVMKPYRAEIKAQLSKKWAYEMGWKSMDFVICDPATTKVLGAIEIDDLSHNDPKRAACDLTKNVIFSSVGLPLLRFTNEQILDLADKRYSELQSKFSKMVTSAEKEWQTTVSKL